MWGCLDVFCSCFEYLISNLFVYSNTRWQTHCAMCDSSVKVSDVNDWYGDSFGSVGLSISGQTLTPPMPDRVPSPEKWPDPCFSAHCGLDGSASGRTGRRRWLHRSLLLGSAVTASIKGVGASSSVPCSWGTGSVRWIYQRHPKLCGAKDVGPEKGPAMGSSFEIDQDSLLRADMGWICLRITQSDGASLRIWDDWGWSRDPLWSPCKQTNYGAHWLIGSSVGERLCPTRSIRQSHSDFC